MSDRSDAASTRPPGRPADDPTRTAGPGRPPADPARTSDPAATAHGPYTPGTADGPPPAARADLPSVPGYELLGELGRGGVGVVYQAREVALNRVVALKVLAGGAGSSPSRLVRFRQEAEAVARVQHPHIVQVFGTGVAGGSPYLALEYVDGGTLQQRTAGVPQPPREAARLVETVARAAHHAHQMRVVHRDLKPSNVLLTAAGVPKVADFGLARLLDADAGPTLTADFVGTPAYSAPEQVRNRPGAAVGPAADVWALGVILYELLTGRRPFEGGSVPGVMRAVVERDPVPPRRLKRDVPRDLGTVCLRCLEKDPRKRYASASDLADDLRRFLAGEPVKARPVGYPGRAWRWAKRHPDLAALFGVVLGLLAAVAAVAVAAAVRVESARDEAVAAAARAARAEADRGREAEQAWAAAAALLDEAEADLGRDRPRDAGLSLGQADQRVGPDAPAALRDRLAALRAEYALVVKLDGIRDRRWRLTGDRLDPAGAAAEYRAALAGLGVGADPAAVGRVRRRPTAGRLTDGLGDWLADTPDPGERAALAAVLADLDPNPTAVEVRAAFAAGDPARLARLAGAAAHEADWAALRPGFAAWLGSRPEVPLGRAADLFRAATRAHPADYPLLYSAGRRLQGRLNDEAIGFYRAAIAVRPDNPTAWNDLAGTYHDKGDFAAAAEYWAEALKRDPASAWINLNLAFANLRVGRPDRAMAHARRVEELRPADPAGPDAVGRVMTNQGDHRGAVAAFRRAAALAPDNHGVAGELGRALLRTGDPAGAEAAFRTVVRVRPADDGGWVGLAFALGGQGRYAAAAAELRKALAANPGWAADPTNLHRYNLACSLARAGTGRGVDAPPPAGRPALRREARDRLAAALAEYRRRAAAVPASPRPEVHQWMAHWLADEDFAAVRHPFRLAALPADEAAAWVALWAEVRLLRDETAPPVTAPPPRPAGR